MITKLKTSTPTERVEAYIRDWHQCWLKHGGENGLGISESAESLLSAMDEWSKSLKQSAGVHWAKGCVDPSASGFGTPPEHDPTAEKVRRTSVNGPRATVETVRTGGYSPRFSEYELRLERGNWRILKVIPFFHEEGEPLLNAVELRKLLCGPRLRVALPLPKSGDEPNCELLFKSGHRFKGSLMSEEGAVSVRKVGKLSLPSGSIVVRDFGDSPDEARPLSLRVPPSDYEVEVACLDRTIAAVRVVFAKSKGKRFSYRRAVELDRTSSVIGVDAGNVSICDARAFFSRTKRQHERDYEAWCNTSLGLGREANGTVLLKLGDSKARNAVVVHSGHGDGGYPAYWVFDSTKKLVGLVVDFLVAAEFQSRTLKLPWPAGATGEIYRENRKSGLRVRVDRASAPGVVVSGGSVDEIRWLDRGGTVVGTNKECGSWSSGDEHGWYVDLNKLDRFAAKMEIVLYAGYRNI